MRWGLRLFLLFVFTLALYGAVEAQSGMATIGLRAAECVGEGGSCDRTRALDGVRVCFNRAGQQERCFFTEDGEYWEDSMPSGANFARAEVPEGYRFVEAGCSGTDINNRPYARCKFKGLRAHFKVRPDTNAIYVTYLFVRE